MNRVSITVALTTAAAFPLSNQATSEMSEISFNETLYFPQVCWEIIASFTSLNSSDGLIKCGTIECIIKLWAINNLLTSESSPHN